MRAMSRLQQLVAQVCAAGPGKRVESVPTKIGDHQEGRQPLHPQEESGLLLPDGRKRRKLPDLEPGSLDLDATRAKYASERQKRVDFTSKFSVEKGGKGRMYAFPRLDELAATGDPRFKAMLEDPYVKTPDRAPLTDQVDYAVIGGGYGGLIVGARLVEQGIKSENIRLFDKGGDFGGTWYWNRYPGAMCDIEAYCYLPLCDELGYQPAEKYCHQPEMMVHSQIIAEKYGLYDNCCLGAMVQSIRWDDATSLWTVGTDRNDAVKARHVIVNFGPFSQPKLPAVPGVETFEGHMWHTSRWDYNYTGGSSAGGLTKLADKRIAIVGTGATAIQCVPHLGNHAKQLYVFQRTPSTMDVRNNHHTTPEYAARYLSKPGWQKERIANFGKFLDGSATAEDENMVNDGWTGATERTLQVRAKMATLGEVTPQMSRDMMDRADYEHVERIRMRIDAIVDDKKTADALKPYYRLFCKRPCFHDDYLPTFNKPNVTLVDTNGEGIHAITKKGVVANGVEYEVDAICLATGFETGFALPGQNQDGVGAASRKAAAQGYEIYGRGGLRLADYWEEGPRSYWSIATRNFPNIWWMNGPQGLISNSATAGLEQVATHIAHICGKMEREGKKICEVSEAAEAEYCQMIYDGSLAGRKFYAQCTPGYYSNEGEVDLTTKSYQALYPMGDFYPKLLERRENGTALEHFIVN